MVEFWFILLICWIKRISYFFFFFGIKRINKALHLEFRIWGEKTIDIENHVDILVLLKMYYYYYAKTVLLR